MYKFINAGNVLPAKNVRSLKMTIAQANLGLAKDDKTIIFKTRQKQVNVKTVMIITDETGWRKRTKADWQKNVSTNGQYFKNLYQSNCWKEEFNIMTKPSKEMRFEVVQLPIQKKNKVARINVQLITQQTKTK